ncbi:MAG: bifunctional methionine sulfoxide reductase B/A protein [Pseudomonadota bacterium]|nr:bifunctional methionine sulfoxide reductase B/A protein [Pseudomonadota bacterium]
MTKFNPLTPEAHRVIIDKGTEPPFSGEYDVFFNPGVYVCRQCNAPLYESANKFASDCGWPSFDQEVPGMVQHTPDDDGRRTEITCANCGGHLGHVFTGEHYTDTNTRHCVNSISLQFIPEANYAENYATAVFASGCFWGTEYWLEKAEGVIVTTVGYAGGNIANPTYRQVCSSNTGHAEAVRVFYNPHVISYEQLVQLFYETHDPTQINSQGPDIGSQYRSAIFYSSPEQHDIAERVSNVLRAKGYNLATKIEPLTSFYPEQDPHHQKYYDKQHSTPYCHIFEKKF